MKNYWIIIAVVLLIFSAGCGPKRKAPLRVGLVFDAGGRGDKSFNDSAYSGLNKAAKLLGVSTDFLEPGSARDRKSCLELFASEGFDLIIGAGYIFGEDINSAAMEFPKIKFVCIDHAGTEPGKIPDNLEIVKFKEQEGSALVGVIAGMSTRTNIVGFLGGLDTPLIRKFEAGFRFGVKYANPSCRVISEYASDSKEPFQDPAQGYRLAMDMYGHRADIIYQAAGKTGLGAFEAAKKTGKLVIGVDSDQYMAGFQPEKNDSRTLTSMVKRVDRAVFGVIKSACDGDFKGGIRTLGLAEGGVGYVNDANNRKKLSEAGIKMAEKLKKDIISGAVDIPAR